MVYVAYLKNMCINIMPGVNMKIAIHVKIHYNAWTILQIHYVQNDGWF